MSSIWRAFARALSLGSVPGQAVIVVGMHRSGTSFVTGSLQQAGVELGHHSAWNPHNLKGNRENPDIVALHEDMLAARGAAWDRPPPGRVKWTDAEYGRARAIALPMSAAGAWGFKDPRTLLVIEGWIALLRDPCFVGVFRHPLAVAQSLRTRGHVLTDDEALQLWNAYNTRLLALYERAPFPLLCFDESDAVLHARLNATLRSLRLQELDDDRFFSTELRHHNENSADLPGPIRLTYQRLRERAC